MCVRAWRCTLGRAGHAHVLAITIDRARVARGGPFDVLVETHLARIAGRFPRKALQNTE